MTSRTSSAVFCPPDETAITVELNGMRVLDVVTFGQFRVWLERNHFAASDRVMVEMPDEYSDFMAAAQNECRVLEEQLARLVCERCGCSDHNACPEGCSWIRVPTPERRGLCSRCRI
jgi:hypothetical protein